MTKQAPSKRGRRVLARSDFQRIARAIVVPYALRGVVIVGSGVWFGKEFDTPKYRDAALKAMRQSIVRRLERAATTPNPGTWTKARRAAEKKRKVK